MSSSYTHAMTDSPIEPVMILHVNKNQKYLHRSYINIQRLAPYKAPLQVDLLCPRPLHLLHWS